MAYREWLIGLLTRSGFSPAKAQRRKEEVKALELNFAPLRLCGRNILFLFMFVVIPCYAQPRNPMRPADLVKIASVAEAQISPNGQWVVYSVSSVDEDKNVSTLLLTRAGSDTRSGPRTLLPPGWNASNPRWSPDSNSIAFLSAHDDQDGLWIV